MSRYTKLIFGKTKLMITATIIAAVYAIRKELGLDESDTEHDAASQVEEKAEGTEMKVINKVKLSVTNSVDDAKRQQIP